ncbi:MAG: zinc-dependent metalloprotease [bacterium]|nr:zinc-dependent metalloprotease [bacterium]
MRLFSILIAIYVIAGLLAGASTLPASASASDENLQSLPHDDGDEKRKNRGTRDKWSSSAAHKSDKEDEKDTYKPWKKVTKDATKHEGVFNVWTKREDVYFEIGEEHLDKPMALFMNVSKGIGTTWVLGGMPTTILETIMIDFHRTEDHIQIRRINPRFRAGGDEALENAVALTFGNSILASLKIESENKDKAVLIKVNSFFLSDVSDISQWMQIGLDKPVRLDSKRNTFGRLNAFPKNVEIEALLTFTPVDRRGLNLPSVPDSRYIEVGINYSIQTLPEEPMKPRLGDDRIGFYMTEHKDFSRDANDNFFVYYVNRWRLEKKDPNAALSEPVKPITYYLDHTIPEQYKKYVKRGVEMWQRAFEDAGFKNAIIAVDPGDDPEYHAEDARYNTIRWIVSDQPSFGAIGPHRTDPRTGEILESDILMEQSMIASFRRTYRRYAGPETFINSDPMIMWLKDPSTNPDAAAFTELQKRFGFMCDFSFGLTSGIELMQLALLMDGDGMETPEEYVGAAIAEVTAHEVGHGIGMRHNFKSSTAVPFEALNNKRVIEEIGMTGSVMDYASPNVSRDRSKQGYYWSPVVGTADHWVVKYGYTQLAGDLTPDQEREELRKTIADNAHLKENTYGTDEDTYPAGALDPACMIWDLSDDPMAWAEERMGVCEDILTNEKFVERVVSDGESFSTLRNAVITVLIQEYIAGSRAVRYIGGQDTARPHRGSDNGDTPLMPTSAAKQRDAMDFLAKHVFAKNAFAISPELLHMLQDDKMRNWQNNVWAVGRRFDFPYTSWVGWLQNGVMFQLMHPMRLQRMVDVDYTVDDPYTIAEMLRTMTTTIWTDNMVPSGDTAVMQRNLQRRYTTRLINMVVAPAGGGIPVPSEAVSLARLNLTRLGQQIDRASAQQGLNDEANAHLLESKARINRALGAKMYSSF